MSIFIFLGYIYSLILSIISSLMIYKNREKYGITTIAYLNIIIIIFNGIVFSSFFFFSTEILFSNSINKNLWKGALMSEISSFWLYALGFSFLKEYRKIPTVFFLYFTILFSINLGVLISLHPIIIEYVYIINFSSDIICNFFLIVNNLSFGVFYIIYFIKISKISNFKNLNRVIFIYTFILLVDIILFCLYLIWSETIFRILFIFVYWLIMTIKCVFSILKPRIYIALTNNVYFIHIYHKTGVLLYSYQFEKSLDPETSSAVWGNILIGLNHILSEFIDKEDQIDVLQTTNAEIIVNYNNEYGFATLVITNQKNSLIENSMQQLTDDFESKYREELTNLQDINKIINVSDFKDAKKIIEKNFKLYL
ncbi:MAG: hypothetical protein GF317_07520 [Candidatus Lokiarchaeota archaeon]|nr:hypothetical protein [Candidatus Lokiarchaeota archaeon]MBD3199558.1 hypothetical protein [Candidatus Lokiarchaeota archaeon]